MPQWARYWQGVRNNGGLSDFCTDDINRHNRPISSRQAEEKNGIKVSKKRNSIQGEPGKSICFSLGTMYRLHAELHQVFVVLHENE
eukprot:15353501-Ditylum_brightwellii.AAC.2